MNKEYVLVDRLGPLKPDLDARKPGRPPSDGTGLIEK